MCLNTGTTSKDLFAGLSCCFRTLQILAMVRFLPSLWDTAAPLQFADLSSFFQFAAFDCILPGPPDKLAYTRILLTAFGVPALLFVVFLLAWIARWSLHRLGAVLHQRAISHSVVGKQHSAQGMPASGASSAVSGSAAVQPPPRAAAEVGPGAPASVRMGDVYRNVSSASGSGTPTVPASSSNSSSLPRSRSSWLPSAASSVIASVPSAALARLQTFGAQRPPVSLRRYLSVRLTITAVVLGYSCYSMFTSQMLQTLACHPIREVAGANDAAAGYGYGNLIKDFGDLHSRWLWERWQGLQAVSGARDLALEMPALCQGSKAASGAGTCQVRICELCWQQVHADRCNSARVSCFAWCLLRSLRQASPVANLARQLVDGSAPGFVCWGRWEGHTSPSGSYTSMITSGPNKMCRVFFALLQVSGQFWKQDYSVQVGQPAVKLLGYQATTSAAGGSAMITLAAVRQSKHSPAAISTTHGSIHAGPGSGCRWHWSVS